MHKDKLMGKYVQYQIRCLIKKTVGGKTVHLVTKKKGGCRLGKVIKITGNTLTVVDAYKERHRINTKNAQIFGVLKKRKVSGKTQDMYLEEIEWN